MSLQSELLENIQKVYPKEVSIDELFGICHLLNHKQSTGERKLRVLTHSGLIEPIFTEKKAIRAYKALEPKTLIINTLKEKIQNPLFEMKIPLN